MLLTNFKYVRCTLHREKKPTFITLNSLIIFNIFVVEQHNNKKKEKNEKYKVYINWLSAKTKQREMLEWTPCFYIHGTRLLRGNRWNKSVCFKHKRLKAAFTIKQKMFYPKQCYKMGRCVWKYDANLSQMSWESGIIQGNSIVP